MARAHDVTAAQVVLRWHVQHDVVVIPKSVSQERMATNLDILGFELTAEQMAAIDAPALIAGQRRSETRSSTCDHPRTRPRWIWTPATPSG